MDSAPEHPEQPGEHRPQAPGGEEDVLPPEHESDQDEPDQAEPTVEPTEVPSEPAVTDPEPAPEPTEVPTTETSPVP